MLNFDLLPLSHWIFLPICWISFFIYLRLLLIIHRGRQGEFKSSYFQIVQLHAITDIAMFLYVELIARPRKYHILDFWTADLDPRLAQFCYFLQTWMKNVIFLGYAVVAINRCTVIVLESRKKMWSSTVIHVIYLLEWIVPFVFLAPLFYTGTHNFSFVESPTHLILLRATPEFMKLDALQDFWLSTACFVLSTIAYFITFGRLIKQLQTATDPTTTFYSNLQPISTPTLQTEVIILKCAFFSFILFTPNFIKTTVLYFATNAEVVNFGTELWFFTTELMCISSPWSLLISSRALRDQCVPGGFGWRRPAKNVVSVPLSQLRSGLQ